MPLRAAATTDAAIGSTWTDIGDSADRELLLLSLCGLCGAQHGETCHPDSRDTKWPARPSSRRDWSDGRKGTGVEIREKTRCGGIEF